MPQQKGILTMSKAEKFIKERTMNCSNQIINGNYGTIIPHFTPWLTPYQARKAVEIAREETLNKVCEWLNKNVAKYLVDTSIHGVKVTGIHISLTEDLRKVLEE